MPNPMKLQGATPSMPAPVAGLATAREQGEPTLLSVDNHPFDANAGPAKPCSPAVLAVCGSALNKPGKFSVVEGSPGQHYLVHRSSDLTLVAQRIVPADGGGVRVELLRAPRDTCWMLMGQRFRDIDEVRQLARGFMTEIPMTAARPSP
ncbi:hypothetical protein [Stenotrophomonas sp.]|uniref:hypothetical protein n=1 Tax=Stenotrophomonas sp. TaxID=69392 RepID=UPI0028AE8FB1|nr:hypothetical protein [Stenotrophomonas sp.]